MKLQEPLMNYGVNYKYYVVNATFDIIGGFII